MAEASLRKIEEQVTCSICLETYSDPKVLQCSHAYCKSCLEKLLSKGKSTLTCPTCRKETVVPENGVTGLEPAFYINHFFEIQDSIKSVVSSQSFDEAKDSTSESFSSLGKERGERAPFSKKALMCPEHGANELQLYCTTCQEVICFQCTIRNHNGHQYDLVSEVAEKHRQELSDLLRPVEQQSAAVGKDLAQIEARHKEVSDMRALIEGNIHEVIQEVHKAVDERETELMDQLDKITHRKLKCLEIERDRKETMQEELSRCAKQVRDSIAAMSETEMLAKKKALVTRVECMTITEFPSSFSSDVPDVDTGANMLFSVLPDFTHKWRNFGQILTPQSIDPMQCTVRGKGLEMAGVGTLSVVYLKANNYTGKPFLDPIPSLECVLVFERTGATEMCYVESKGQNLHEISYQPTSRGKHQLLIKIKNQHVSGSPYSLAVHTPVEKIKRPTSVKYDIPQPWGVAINKRDEVIITECDKHQVTIFKLDGEKIRSFGGYGSRNNQLRHPRGVAVDGDGNILVVDSFNHRIQKYTSDGEFLATCGSHGNGPLQFIDPKGIAFNTINDKVYVVDNECVQILTSNLTFSGVFGNASGNGKLSNPFSVACDSTGNVYVADKSSVSIQVYTPQGQFLRMFQSEGYSSHKPTTAMIKSLWGSVTKAPGPSSAPVAIAIDDCDLVYVSDDSFHHVSVLTCDGQLKASIGRDGIVAGEFKRPRGIAVNSSGMIYVCDFENDRVQVF